MKKGETEISRAIADYLDARRIYHLRLQSGRVKKGGSWIHLCETGTPDRLAIVDGRPVFVEVKRPGEEPTAEQREQHKRIEGAGGRVIVATSARDFAEQLGALDWA